MNSYMFKQMLTWFMGALNSLVKVNSNVGRWDLHYISSYSALLFVTWSPWCYLNMYIDVLIIPALFSLIHNWSQIIPALFSFIHNWSQIIPALFLFIPNYSQIILE